MQVKNSFLSRVDSGKYVSNYFIHFKMFASYFNVKLRCKHIELQFITLKIKSYEFRCHKNSKLIFRIFGIIQD